MVDWNGLFKWSMQYHDGTEESKFKQMSKEDREWLEEAMKTFTFNDTDRMKEIVEILGPEKIINESKDKVLSMLDELAELIELHPRNGINFCLGGGMQVLVDIMIENGEKDVRKMACVAFSQLC